MTKEDEVKAMEDQIEQYKQKIHEIDKKNDETEAEIIKLKQDVEEIKSLEGLSKTVRQKIIGDYYEMISVLYSIITTRCKQIMEINTCILYLKGNLAITRGENPVAVLHKILLVKKWADN